MDEVDLLGPLTEWLLRSSFEGTVRCETIVKDVGDPFGTFAGAVVMMTTALVLGRRAGPPPSYVLYLGAFYVLTPGSHGLRGLESWIGGHPIQGVAGVADMVGLLVAIAVGMLVVAATAGPRARLHPAEG